jgi:hypothetical protein
MRHPRRPGLDGDDMLAVIAAARATSGGAEAHYEKYVSVKSIVTDVTDRLCSPR